MGLIEAGVMLAWMAAAVLLAVYAASIASEITYVTLADGRKAERKIPLVFRMLLPFAGNFSKVVEKVSFAKQRTMADEMIVSAGLEGLLTGSEFIALKFLLPIAGGLLLLLLDGSIFQLMDISVVGLGYVTVLGLLFLYMYPLMWLRSTLKKRHMSIMRALPFVLDLLTLSVEAGMDFMSAVQRNCEKRKPDPLNEELIRMICEIQMGESRKTAMKNMANRVKQNDLRAVSSALVQADELGVPIGTILRIQSDQLRSRRFDRAEKLANEAPVKMLGPLLLFIFPAVFLILLMPILMQAAKSVF